MDVRLRSRWVHMPTLSLEMLTAAVTNLRHAVGLLDLSRVTRASDKASFDNARANVAAACDLLTEFPALPQTTVSAAKLLLKAELALAAMDWSRGNLSLRVADSLVLETRVRIESLDPSMSCDDFTQTVPVLRREQ
jgi:hypothetical protein